MLCDDKAKNFIKNLNKNHKTNRLKRIEEERKRELNEIKEALIESKDFLYQARKRKKEQRNDMSSINKDFIKYNKFNRYLDYNRDLAAMNKRSNKYKKSVYDNNGNIYGINGITNCNMNSNVKAYGNGGKRNNSFGKGYENAYSNEIIGDENYHGSHTDGHISAYDSNNNYNNGEYYNNYIGYSGVANNSNNNSNLNNQFNNNDYYNEDNKKNEYLKKQKIDEIKNKYLYNNNSNINNNLNSYNNNNNNNSQEFINQLGSSNVNNIPEKIYNKSDENNLSSNIDHINNISNLENNSNNNINTDKLDMSNINSNNNNMNYIDTDEVVVQPQE